MQLLSNGAECRMANIFRVSHIVQLISRAFEIIAKNEKRGKYMPILHDKPCDNYFIVILVLDLVMTTLSICDSIKIRISSERGVEKLCLRNNMLPA